MFKTKTLCFLLVTIVATIFPAPFERVVFGQTSSATVREYQNTRDDLLGKLESDFLKGVSSQKMLPKFEKHQRDIVDTIEELKDASSPPASDIEYLQAELDIWRNLEKRFLQVKSIAERIVAYRSRLDGEVVSAKIARDRWVSFFSGTESFLTKVDTYRQRYQRMALPINKLITLTAAQIDVMSGTDLTQALLLIKTYEDMLKDVGYTDMARYYLSKRSMITNIFQYDLVEQYETLEKQTREFERLQDNLTNDGKSAIATKLINLSDAHTSDRGIYSRFETAIDRFLQGRVNETNNSREEWQTAVAKYEDATRDDYPSISRWFKARFKDSRQTITRLRLWYSLEMTEIPNKVNEVEALVIERKEELDED